MKKIAIAVRDSQLFHEATIVRKAASDVYINYIRDYDPDWKPHASYHASGQFHHKSYGTKLLAPVLGQRPDANFTGTEHLGSFGIATGESRVQPICDTSKFSDVVEIPVALLRPEKHTTYVYTDLVAPGEVSLLYPGAQILQQRQFTDAAPWIVVTLLYIALPAAAA